METSRIRRVIFTKKRWNIKDCEESWEYWFLSPILLDLWTATRVLQTSSSRIKRTEQPYSDSTTFDGPIKKF